jgi:hypothetical protein
MSISSVTASPAVKTPEAREAKAPDLKNDNEATNSRRPQPARLAPLPPGQGTRIDQLV